MKWIFDNETILREIGAFHLGVDRGTFLNGILLLFGRYVAAEVSTEFNALFSESKSLRRLAVLDPQD